METFHRIKNWIAALFGHLRKNSDLEDEIMSHIEMRTELNIEAGMAPDLARKEAMRGFGNAEALKEDCRDSWGTRVVMDLIRDIGYSLRNMRATPGSSILVVLIMAFGIGISMTMFTFVKGMLWSNMGFPDEDRLIDVKWGINLKADRTGPHPIRVDDYLEFEKYHRTLEYLVGFSSYTPGFRLAENSDYPEKIRGSAVASNFFNLLGVSALYGRTFGPEDVVPGGERLIVLSYEFWQSKFGGELDALNATVYIGAAPCRVIGVMPPEFSTFPLNSNYWRGVDIDTEWGVGQPRQRRAMLSILGLKKEGVSDEQVEADLEAIAERLAEEYPESNEYLRDVQAQNHGKGQLHGEERNLLYALLFCGVLVLLVACANVSNLMLVRAARRSFELATRNALGASRAHIMYQVILDSFLLTAIGGIVGLFVASYGSDYIWSIYAPLDADLPFWWDVEIDVATICVAIGAMIIAALGGSFVPALRGARRNSFALLRDDSRTSSSLYMGKLSKVLVGLQITFALSLTIVATVMVLVQYAAVSQEKIYDRDKIALGFLWLSGPLYKEKESYLSYQRNLRERMIEKGAENVCFLAAGSKSLGEVWWWNRFEKAGESYGDPTAMPEASVLDVSPEYFDVFGFKRAFAGRLFSHADTEGSETVVIVNRAFVETHFPHRTSPIGEQIRVQPIEGRESGWARIVGIVENYVDKPLPEESWSDYAVIYRPFAQNLVPWVTAAAKFGEDARPWTTTLHREMGKLAPDNAFNQVRSVRDEMAFEESFNRLIVKLYAFFGVITFLVASIGLYAVVSFSAGQRVREFGVRMALGAHSKDIIYSVAKTGVVQALAGLVLGVLVGQMLAQHLSKSMNLVGLPPVWITSAIAVILILTTTAISMLAPSVKAARLDPVKALRS